MTSQKIKPPLKEDGKLDIDSAKKYRKCTLKILFLAGVTFLIILNISQFVVFVYTLSRVKQLENDVYGSKDTLNHIKYRDDNLINEIEGFEDEDVYDEDHEVDMENDPQILMGKPDELSYYVDYDNYDDRTTNQTETDDNMEQIGNIRMADSIKQETDLSRKRRDIVAATNEGVVINSESYAERKARNNTRKKMHSRNGYLRKPVYADSYFSRPLSPRHNNSGSTPTSRTLSPYIHTNLRNSTRAPPPVYTRRSRVMHTEDKSKAFRRVVKKASLKSGNLLDSDEETTSESDFTIVRDNGYAQKRYRQRHLGLENLDEGHHRIGRIKLPSVHYSGDTSRYVVGQHENFNGNGHLKHPQRTFADWKVSDWVKSAGLDAYFTMEDGIVTIKEAGIYFVYAQIYYLDEHDTTGFRVFRNRETILQCTVTAHSTERRLKGNTCYTGGVEYLSENDNISLADVTDGRYSLFEPGKSFFGLIKIGDVKIK